MGEPDEQFIPRRDLTISDDVIAERAHEFAEAAANTDAALAITKLYELSPIDRGEVVRRGLAELAVRQEGIGHAERLVHLARHKRRIIGRAALGTTFPDAS